MPRSSRLAQLQRALVITLVIAAAVWALAWWPRHPWVAAVGAVAILFGHAVMLGLEFLLLVPVSRADPAPRPAAGDLLRAWMAEVVEDVRVFGWRQPFAWWQVPDHLPATPTGRCGVVFVHGFICNRGFWTPWMRRARAAGHPFAAVNLEPVFGPIDGYAQAIEDAVVRVTAASGRAPVLVSHSMGGLAARAWLRRHGGVGRVAHVVTIGTPHHGTWLARFSRLANGRQMRVDSEWLRELQRCEVRGTVRFTCWYSNCDNVVMPSSTATLPDADNRFVAGSAHVDLAFHPRVMDETWALVRGL